MCCRCRFVWGTDWCWRVRDVWLFFFKQKTAYEMRISDWSSDVCSSDLHPARPLATGGVNILRHRAYFFAATALSFAMPAFAAEAPIYAAPGAWVVPNTAPLTDGPDARPWLLADRQVLIEGDKRSTFTRSEEHTSELQSLMRKSYAVLR